MYRKDIVIEMDAQVRTVATNGSDGRLRLAHLGGRIGTAIPPCPGQNRSGLVPAQENARILVTLSRSRELPLRDARRSTHAE